MWRAARALIVLSLAPAPAGAQDAAWVAVGAARVDVTPAEPVLLAGYGARTRPHAGVDARLFARALVLGEARPLVLVAVDNAGVPGALVAEVARRLARERGVEHERLVVCATHTHTAPNLPGYAPIIWAERASAAEEEVMERYATRLTDALVEAVTRALDARRPARLEWGQGRVGFGGNRRVVAEGTWRGFGFQRDGPVDHSLPLLVARDAEEAVVAVWFTYACHCTTLGSHNRVSGDWAGFASERLEAELPGAVALCTIGCGADVGPQPAGSLEIARGHGDALVAEVTRLLGTELTPLGAPSAARAREVRLPLAEVPGREHWERLAQEGGFAGAHARLMLARIERAGDLPDEVALPVTAWRFGDALAIVFLGGEVVVDYAVRLKTELDWTRLWINAWADDVPCYIPSERVLAEGGYEADFSQLYYGQPARFDTAVEERLVGAVRGLVGADFTRRRDTPAPDFLALPDADDLFVERLPAWVRARPPGERPLLERVVGLAPRSLEGCARLLENDGEHGSWYDHTGEQNARPLLRQLEAGAELTWETAPLARAPGAPQVFVFLGGLGWESEPDTAGFALLVDGEPCLTFDVTRAATTWAAPGGGARLHFLPTWSSDQDSAGFFWLVLEGSGRPERPRVLTVRSLGEGSRRWFALDVQGIAKRLEGALVVAVEDGR